MFAFVSRIPWHDTPGDWQTAAQVAEGATVVLSEWHSELKHRHSRCNTRKLAFGNFNLDITLMRDSLCSKVVYEIN